MINFKNKKIDVVGIFDIFMAILAFVSILNVVIAYMGIVNLKVSPYFQIQLIIEMIYVVELVIRFIYSKHKAKFFSDNLLDIISIIPFHPFFVLFRIVQFYRIISHYKLLYKFHLSTPLTHQIHDFLFTRGFIYLISISMGIIILAALGYSLAEHISLGESLWWAIVTATTVGYGDISPHTVMGKLIAVILMILGIGFIGLLTSNLIQFITSQTTLTEQDDLTDLNKKMDKMLDLINKQQKEIKILKKMVKPKTATKKNK